MTSVKAVFRRITNEIRERKRKNRAFVVGISGIDTSGKTVFAKGLAEHLRKQGFAVQKISLDDFHNKKKVRYEGKSQAENYFRKSFDLKTIVEKLLKPVREKKSFKTNLILLDLFTDRYEVRKKYSFSPKTIVVFEGVFLFRKELSKYVDYKIFLQIPFKESKKRAAKRDVPVHGRSVLKKYDEKYLPAQKNYLKKFPPQKTADLVIDNTDFNNPKIVGG